MSDNGGDGQIKGQLTLGGKPIEDVEVTSWPDLWNLNAEAATMEYGFQPVDAVEVEVVDWSGTEQFVTSSEGLKLYMPVPRWWWLRWVGVRVYKLAETTVQVDEPRQMRMENGAWSVEQTLWPVEDVRTYRVVTVWGREVYRREIECVDEEAE